MDEKELNEVTFKPRLIAEEKLQAKDATGPPIEMNYEAVDLHAQRLEKGRILARQRDFSDDMVGSGKHWRGKLTEPEPPEFHLDGSVGLEKVKCITKPVVRNGEIVRDAQVQIRRHELHPLSEKTQGLYAQKTTAPEQNDTESLFSEGKDFEDCVEALHLEIQAL